jgi:hypothetical protein
MSIEKARELILASPKSQIDTILSVLNISHAKYRRSHPETPVTSGLALDILDAKDIDEMSNEDIREKWNLNRSQLAYALYNDNALKSEAPDLVLARIELDLKEGKSQTDTAKENGVSQSYVHGVAKRLDLCPKNRKKRVKLTKEQFEVIKAQIEGGVPVDHLARKYNISRDTIYKRLK